MKKSEQYELKTIIDLITKPNYDSIDLGVSLLIKAGKDIYFEKILKNCIIINGILIASRRFTVTATRQPFIDYALWNIIGFKPKSVVVHKSLSKASIKKVRLREYESYLHWFNKIEKFPLGITFLENIEILDFSDARIKFIPDDITRLSKLKSIDVCNNEIKKFPIFLCKIHTLESIKFSRNKIKKIPNDIIKLKNLEYLYLDYTEINTLPSGIKELQKLKCLSISNNNISEIPFEICDLVNLEKISINNSNIKSIPEAFANLQKITELDLSGNELNSIPNLHSKTIKSLNLSRNRITVLNDAIKNMFSLESLYLNENRNLNIVEPGITSLNNLKILELGKTGNLTPKPHVLYLNGRIAIEKYFNKILYHYKLRARFKGEINIKTSLNNQQIKYRPYKDVNKKPAKEIEGVFSSLSNYFNSRELDIVDIGINLMTSIANDSIYNYVFGKCKIIEGELTYMYDYTGFEFHHYSCRNYILLKLLSSKNDNIKIQRNISVDNIQTLVYVVNDFFEKRYPDFIFTFYNLIKVDFSFNNLNLHSDIYKLSKLQKMRLNKVRNLDEIIFDKFPDLKILTLEKSDSTSCLIFENIRNLEEFTIYDVSSKSITIKNNHNLVEISLIGLQIDNLEISNCRNLKKLTIISCQFSNGCNFSDFPKLLEFTSKKSSITRLMDFISKCSNLEKISIINTDGLVIEKSIANIKNVKILNLEDNKLDSIPQEIGELKKLEHLNVSENNLKNIPSSLAKCRNLKNLDIRFQCGKTKAENKLNHFPLELFQIKKLKIIKVSWTPLAMRRFESQICDLNLFSKSGIISNE